MEKEGEIVQVEALHLLNSALWSALDYPEHLLSDDELPIDLFDFWKFDIGSCSREEFLHWLCQADTVIRSLDHNEEDLIRYGEPVMAPNMQGHVDHDSVVAITDDASALDAFGFDDFIYGLNETTTADCWSKKEQEEGISQNKKQQAKWSDIFDYDNIEFWSFEELALLWGPKDVNSVLDMKEDDFISALEPLPNMRDSFCQDSLATIDDDYILDALGFNEFIVDLKEAIAADCSPQMDLREEERWSEVEHEEYDVVEKHVDMYGDELLGMSWERKRAHEMQEYKPSMMLDITCS